MSGPRPLEQASAAEGSEGEESDTGRETKVQRGLEGPHRAEVVIELFGVDVEAGRVGAQCLGNFIVDEAGKETFDALDPSMAWSQKPACARDHSRVGAFCSCVQSRMSQGMRAMPRSPDVGLGLRQMRLTRNCH